MVEKVVGKLAINPTSACFHKAIFTGELGEDILLQHDHSISLEVLGVGHVLSQQTKGVHHSLFVAEVLILLTLQRLAEEGQVVGQILADFVLSGLSDAANGLDQLLIGALDIPGIGDVDLESDILN